MRDSRNFFRALCGIIRVRSGRYGQFGRLDEVRPVDKREAVIFKKYKTFSVLIYSYINRSGNWKNGKLSGNTTPAGRSVFTQFRVFPIFTCVDITVYQYGKNFLYSFII